MSFNRRDFLRTSASLSAVAAAEAAFVAQSHAQDQQQQPAGTGRGDPMERINVACIGVRGQGRSHIAGYAGRNNCVVTHICDVDSSVPESIAPVLTAAQTLQRMAPEYVQDLRRIMDNRNIHAVSIATPNHWHALAAIWAMQAGKHVYVEKPVSHNVWEGRRLVEAARHYNKICQTGTQIRSQQGSIDAIQFLRSGELGAIEVARGLCYKRRGSIGTHMGEVPVPVPATVDYDLWCGPAPRRPLNRTRLHYDWHWQWDYGNGDLGNQGIHQMDVARWGLGKSELCRSAVSVGGRFGYRDDGETANTQVCVFDYGEAPLIFEVRGLVTQPYRGANVGNVFHCANGYLVFTSYTSAVAYNRDGEMIRRFSGNGDHFGNFISAVRSGRREDLKADILEGHLSSALCHLANISYRTGRQLPFMPAPEVFQNSEAARETLTRTEEHLRNNQINLDNETLRVGALLELDPNSETIRNNNAASAMLTREYRTGFEVPARF